MKDERENDRIRSHSFSMPESMVAAIADVADGMGYSMSYVVRLAVRRFLHSEEYPVRRDADDPADDAAGH